MTPIKVAGKANDGKKSWPKEYGTHKKILPPFSVVSPLLAFASTPLMKKKFSADFINSRNNKLLVNSRKLLDFLTQEGVLSRS